MSDDTNKTGTITSKPSKSALKAQKGKGLHKFTYNVDHGTVEKGTVVNMSLSTALALEAHKIGTVGDKITELKKEKK